MNDSTFQFVKKTLKNVSRLGILRSNARFYCREHGLQSTKDIFPNKTVLLACGCKREMFHRTPKEIAAFDTAVTEAQRRRRVNVGKNAGSQWTKIYEEDVEVAA